MQWEAIHHHEDVERYPKGQLKFQSLFQAHRKVEGDAMHQNHLRVAVGLQIRADATPRKALQYVLSSYDAKNLEHLTRHSKGGFWFFYSSSGVCCKRWFEGRHGRNNIHVEEQCQNRMTFQIMVTVTVGCSVTTVCCGLTSGWVRWSQRRFESLTVAAERSLTGLTRKTL